MAKTLEERREANRIKVARYRAKQKGAAASDEQIEVTPASITPESEQGGGPDVLEVDIITSAQETPKLSLKDRLLGKSATSTNKPTSKPYQSKRASKKNSDNLLVTVLPTLAAGFIATYISEMLPDEYKVCAPKKEETAAILAPLFNILSRRVSVYGEASADTVDLINSVIAGIAYGTRAYMMYIDIRNEQREYNNGQVSTPTSVTSNHQYTTRGNGKNTNVRPATDNHRYVESTENAYAAENDVNSSGATSDNSIDEERSAVLSLISATRKRDADYRSRHGLN